MIPSQIIYQAFLRAVDVVCVETRKIVQVLSVQSTLHATSAYGHGVKFIRSSLQTILGSRAEQMLPLLGLPDDQALRQAEIVHVAVYQCAVAQQPVTEWAPDVPIHRQRTTTWARAYEQLLLAAARLAGKKAVVIHLEASIACDATRGSECIPPPPPPPRSVNCGDLLSRLAAIPWSHLGATTSGWIEGAILNSLLSLRIRAISNDTSGQTFVHTFGVSALEHVRAAFHPQSSHTDRRRVTHEPQSLGGFELYSSWHPAFVSMRPRDFRQSVVAAHIRYVAQIYGLDSADLESIPEVEELNRAAFLSKRPAASASQRASPNHAIELRTEEPASFQQLSSLNLQSQIDGPVLERALQSPVGAFIDFLAAATSDKSRRKVEQAIILGLDAIEQGQAAVPTLLAQHEDGRGETRAVFWMAFEAFLEGRRDRTTVLLEAYGRLIEHGVVRDSQDHGEIRLARAILQNPGRNFRHGPVTVSAVFNASDSDGFLGSYRSFRPFRKRYAGISLVATNQSGQIEPLSIFLDHAAAEHTTARIIRLLESLRLVRLVKQYKSEHAHAQFNPDHLARLLERDPVWSWGDDCELPVGRGHTGNVKSLFLVDRSGFVDQPIYALPAETASANEDLNLLLNAAMRGDIPVQVRSHHGSKMAILRSQPLFQVDPPVFRRLFHCEPADNGEVFTTYLRLDYDVSSAKFIVQLETAGQFEYVLNPFLQERSGWHRKAMRPGGFYLLHCIRRIRLGLPPLPTPTGSGSVTQLLGPNAVDGDDDVEEDDKSWHPILWSNFILGPPCSRLPNPNLNAGGITTDIERLSFDGPATGIIWFATDLKSGGLLRWGSHSMLYGHKAVELARAIVAEARELDHSHAIETAAEQQIGIRRVGPFHYEASSTGGAATLVQPHSFSVDDLQPGECLHGWLRLAVVIEICHLERLAFPYPPKGWRDVLSTDFKLNHEQAEALRDVLKLGGISYSSRLRPPPLCVASSRLPNPNPDSSRLTADIDRLSFHGPATGIVAFSQSGSGKVLWKGRYLRGGPDAVELARAIVAEARNLNPSRAVKAAAKQQIGVHRIGPFHYEASSTGGAATLVHPSDFALQELAPAKKLGRQLRLAVIIEISHLEGLPFPYPAKGSWTNIDKDFRLDQNQARELQAVLRRARASHAVESDEFSEDSPVDLIEDGQVSPLDSELEEPMAAYEPVISLPPPPKRRKTGHSGLIATSSKTRVEDPIFER